MSLVRCRECTKEISDQAAACPHCGAPLAPQATAPGVMSCPRCRIAMVPITRPVSVSIAGFFGMAFVLVGLVILLFNFVAGVITILLGVAISKFMRGSETVMTCPSCRHQGGTAL